MEWLQTIAENSGMPVLTAFALGLLTALSPCPLATNIAAVGFISRDIGSRRRIFRNGLLYTLGRTVAYTALGLVLIGLLKEGAAIFRVQKYIARYGEMIIGPVLLVMALFMLAGHRLPLPSFGFSGRGEDLAQRGGWGAFLLGVLFALAFCPSSGILYFGMLIPLSATSAAGWLLRRGDGAARAGHRLDPRVQRTAHRHGLRTDADRPEVAEHRSRHPVYRRRHILLHHIILIKHGNQSIGYRLRIVQGTFRNRPGSSRATRHRSDGRQRGGFDENNGIQRHGAAGSRRGRNGRIERAETECRRG